MSQSFYVHTKHVIEYGRATLTNQVEPIINLIQEITHDSANVCWNENGETAELEIHEQDLHTVLRHLKVAPIQWSDYLTRQGCKTPITSVIFTIQQWLQEGDRQYKYINISIF